MHDNSEFKGQNQDIDKKETIVSEVWIYMIWSDQLAYK